MRGLPAYGSGAATIRGRNFSAWRSGYRVRYGDGWRTLIALSLLPPIVYGFGYYYPYAYVAAPEDYCQGFTEDGCQLSWQPVEAIEGGIVYQCVAYCPQEQPPW